MRFEYSVPLIGIGLTYLQKLVETGPYFPIYSVGPAPNDIDLAPE